MSPAGSRRAIAGISWGSRHFAAYRIVNGRLVDRYDDDAGVTLLDRPGMAAAVARLVARWPDLGAIYAAGMVGSGVGWTETPYLDTPAGAVELGQAITTADVGAVALRIVPGLACVRAGDGAPDVMRGEEVELLGLAAGGHRDDLAVIAGTHAKWCRLEGGRVTEFFTTITTEIGDRLTSDGLLAAVAQGAADDADAFADGLALSGRGEVGLGTTLFGVRARVMRGTIGREAGASYLRGLLIGAEVADADRLFPDWRRSVVTVVGDGPLAAHYANALARLGVRHCRVEPSGLRATGFSVLHDHAGDGR